MDKINKRQHQQFKDNRGKQANKQQSTQNTQTHMYLGMLQHQVAAKTTQQIRYTDDRIAKPVQCSSSMLDLQNEIEQANAYVIYHQTVNKKFELMLTRQAKAYSSSGSVVQLKIGVFTLS